MTSPDGIVWTPRTSAADNQWYSICWSPELRLFCAVAIDSGAGGQVMTSPNGVTWTSRTAAASDVWDGVCWSSELRLFCAVAANAVTSGSIMTSPDGITWTQRTSAANLFWSSVCWAPELRLFCAVAYSGASNRVQTSTIDKIQVAQVAKGSIATTFTASSGPTGAQTALQGWLRMNIAGVDRFIPYW